MSASDQTLTVRTLMVVVLGLAEGFKFAALNNLILRASPPRHEAFICALLSAVAGVGWAVSRLLTEAFHSSVSGLTAGAAVAGAAALFTSSLLPASLVSAREGARSSA